jgi:hypothetical protein
MFALSARHDTNMKAKSETLYLLAKQTTQATLLNPDMSTLIALLLLTVYEIGHPNTSLHAWTTLGSALSVVSAFHLLRMDDDQPHRSNRWLPEAKDWVEEEGRRRAALMAISLARWSSAIQGRDLGVVLASDIDLRLPVSDEIWFAAVWLHPLADPFFSLPNMFRPDLRKLGAESTRDGHHQQYRPV